MRHTRAQTANRRSHHALQNPSLIKCECGAMRQTHRACASCGRYHGRVILDVAGKAAAKAARRTAREKGTAGGQVEEKQK